MPTKTDHRNPVGVRINVDGQSGTIVESHADYFGIRLWNGDFLQVDRDEVEQNRDGRYFLLDYQEQNGVTDKVLWDLLGDEANDDLHRTVGLLNYARDGVIPLDAAEIDRIVIRSYSFDKTRTIEDRTHVVGLLLDIKSRQVWNRLAALREEDPWAITGRKKPRTTAQRFPAVEDAFRALIRKLAKKNLKLGLSKMTKSLFLERLGEIASDSDVPSPSRSVALEVIGEELKALGTFSLDIRSEDGNASREGEDYGHVEATYPGEYVLIDSTVLDVHALNPFGSGDKAPLAARDWHQVELTIALDLYSRCILAIRLSPLSTKGVDLAELIHELFRPTREEWSDTNNVNLPGVGAPSTLLLDWEGSTMSAVRPVTLVVDNGKIYDSMQMRRICRTVGCDLQYGRKLKGSDKAQVERFFHTLRVMLLQRLAGYKGNRPAAHGKSAEKLATYPLEVLNRLVREVIATVYHRADHRGVHPFGDPGTNWAPLEKLHEGLLDSGHPSTITVRDFAVQLLPIEYRTIQHDGVHFGNRTYRGEIIAKYAGRKSSLPGKDGLWPIYFNVARPHIIFFQDPQTGRFHELVDRAAPDWDRPMAMEIALRASEMDSDDAPRATREERDRTVAGGVQGVIDRVGSQLGLPTWKELLRFTSHDDKFRLDGAPAANQNAPKPTGDAQADSPEHSPCTFEATQPRTEALDIDLDLIDWDSEDLY